jgi:hypothetical protein
MNPYMSWLERFLLHITSITSPSKLTTAIAVVMPGSIPTIIGSLYFLSGRVTPPCFLFRIAGDDLNVLALGAGEAGLEVGRLPLAPPLLLGAGEAGNETVSSQTPL